MSPQQTYTYNSSLQKKNQGRHTLQLKSKVSPSFGLPPESETPWDKAVKQVFTSSFSMLYQALPALLFCCILIIKEHRDSQAYIFSDVSQWI